MHLSVPSSAKFALRARMAAVSVAAALSACGPGHVPDLPLPGGGSPGGSGTSAQYQQQCSASNPYLGDATSATSPGSLTVEKQWVRAYLDEAYLWYDRIPSISASLPAYSNDTQSGFYDSIDGYFSDLTVNPLAEDRFSFTYPTKAWNQLSQGGVSLGYGIEFHVGSSTPPREFRVALVDPSSPAALAGVQRGDTLVSVDGVSINDNTASGIDTLNAGLFPSVAGSHTFVFSRNGVTRPGVTLTASEFASNPVPQHQVFDVNGAKVGYILFNEHILTAENRLANAFDSLRSQGVSDLVLDLRYNRGGFLLIASQVGYMVAGTRGDGKTFERLRFNDKRTADNQSSDANMLFVNTLCLPDASFNCTAPAGTTLPTLNLGRVYVLSGPDTCSASEAIINGLRGVDVEVVVIGGTTCGKPYGFTAKDNCGISYFPIEFQGVNAKGFGDYGNGFTANCSVADDFDHALGDRTEGLLAAALNHRATGNCPASGVAKQTLPAGRLLHKPEREVKVLFPNRADRAR
jgi:C-terminal processing protease CtpA/Prc